MSKQTKLSKLFLKMYPMFQNSGSTDLNNQEFSQFMIEEHNRQVQKSNAAVKSARNMQIKVTYVMNDMTNIGVFFSSDVMFQVL